MAPTKKKTPKGKKRKQLATSFKKQNLTPTGSGKNFKKNRSAAKRKQNLSVSSVSAFNASALSPSKASTPLVKSGRTKRMRNIVDNFFKGSHSAESPATDEKATPSTSALASTSANSVESPCPAFPPPVPSVGQDLKNLNDYIARRGQDEEIPEQARIKPTLQDLARKETPRRKKRVRGGPGPPKGKVLKGDLGDMFR